MIGRKITATAGSTTPVASQIINLGISDAQYVGGATNVALDFNVSKIKTDGFTHSTTVEPHKIFVTQTGRYKIGGYIAATGTTSSYRYTAETAISINGGTVRDGVVDGYIRVSDGANFCSCAFYDIVDLTAGDYITVHIKAAGGKPAGNANTLPDKSVFTMEKLEVIQGDTGSGGYTPPSSTNAVVDTDVLTATTVTNTFAGSINGTVKIADAPAHGTKYWLYVSGTATVEVTNVTGATILLEVTNVNKEICLEYSTVSASYKAVR